MTRLRAHSPNRLRASTVRNIMIAITQGIGPASRDAVQRPRHHVVEEPSGLVAVTAQDGNGAGIGWTAYAPLSTSGSSGPAVDLAALLMRVDLHQIGGARGNLAAHVFNFNQRVNQNFFQGRLDYNLSDKHRLSGSFTHNKLDSTPDTTNNREPNFPGFPGTDPPLGSLGPAALEARRSR